MITNAIYLFLTSNYADNIPFRDYPETLNDVSSEGLPQKDDLLHYVTYLVKCGKRGWEGCHKILSTL